MDYSAGKVTGKVTCGDLPLLISSFIDTFIDFTVSDLFFPPPLSQDLNPVPSLSKSSYPSPERLVAIGDLHGDLQKSKLAFRLAGLIDTSDRWIGGSTTVVQIGDVLDRGDDEIKILYFLDKLKLEAAKAGGTIFTMNGNHETMNVESDFRFVTKGGLDEFKNWAYWYSIGNEMKSLCDGLPKPKDIFHGIPSSFANVKQDCHDGIRARIAALRPKGPIASRFLSKNFTVLVVGESVFVHGGLMPNHVTYGFDKINEEVRDWLIGLKEKVSPEIHRSSNSLVWLRKFSHEAADKCDCSTLEHVLATIPGARRMIMGHTIQVKGINTACNDQAIRIDVGMSKGCIDGFPEVLEIERNSGLKVLTSNPLFQNRDDRTHAESASKERFGFLIPEHSPKPIQVEA
ncbi:shewanella-like protein phosphatase 2 [Impatiens glandulifera]|uniref:shewanella-like protein phosphatase 2 n=1 Tax=Impatiens glandulifera TaxID=253017 RepID=UPI001FB0819B|nr:shewanella-like protein phosphatase 2 [Impatiens glandulifera]